MELTTALYLGSAFLGASSYNLAAKRAKQEGALAERRIKEQAKFEQLRALQDHNAIMADLKSYKATNIALAGVSGRESGSDRSLKALLKKAEENTKVAASRSRLQSLAEVSKFSQEAQMAVLRANNKSKAYRLQSFATILNAGYNTSKVV
tara:strand:- start:594 stop:1043 length:450 start_codon:yes stop_codon:yes gene_type:complete